MWLQSPFAFVCSVSDNSYNSAACKYISSYVLKLFVISLIVVLDATPYSFVTTDLSVCLQVPAPYSVALVVYLYLYLFALLVSNSSLC
jgi:hypothetical protein